MEEAGSTTMRRHWLTPERLRLYPRLFALLYVLGAVLMVWTSHAGLDRYGQPLGHDFIEFWAAAKLALAGAPASAYDLATIFAAERMAVPGITTPTAWLYPPGFLLFIAPLGWLPYFGACAVFLAVTFAAYCAVLRRLLPSTGGIWLVLGFPGVYINAIQGQNGFLTAALIGAALLSLPRRPVLAGVLIGLLTIKPQLGLLLPVALLCGRCWRAIGGALLSASLLLGLSVAILGEDVLGAFLPGMARFSTMVVHDPRLMSKVPTAFSLALMSGAPVGLALGLHALVAVPTAAAVGWIWIRVRDPGIRSAALVAGSLLVSPYFMDYDLAWLALPIFWLARMGLREGWLPGEREVLAAAWLLPLVLAPLAYYSHLQLGMLPLLALFAIILRRARREAPEESGSPDPETKPGIEAPRPHWLNRERLALYSGGLLAACLFVAFYMVCFGLRHGIDRDGIPLGCDFIVYWGASKLALAGNAAASYDPQALLAALRPYLPSLPGTPPWVYPPAFHLLVLPLGLLPYFAAYAGFMLVTFAAYFALVWKILPTRQVILPMLGFPAVWINLLQGQNGFLTASLAAAALLLLPRRPLAAGALVGLLSIKPQLALLFPIALIAGCHWRALAAAVLVALALLALSTAVLGDEVVPAFVAHAPAFAAAVVDDVRLLGRNPSFFAFARLLGAPPAFAAALQIGVAAAVAAALARTWRHCPTAALRYAALATGSLLASPYLLNYDLAWLALPLAWFSGYCVRHGWLRWEREVLALAWLLPLAMSVPYALLRLQLAPFVLLALFLVILRRANQGRGESTECSVQSSSRSALSLPPHTAPVSRP